MARDLIKILKHPQKLLNFGAVTVHFGKKKITNDRLILMISAQQNFVRGFARATLDLRTLMRQGEYSEVKKAVFSDYTTNPTNLTGQDFVKTSRLVDQIELVASNMLESNLDKFHTSVGYFVELENKQPIAPGMSIKMKAEAVEIKPTKVIFKTTIRDADTDEILCEGTHGRAILKY